MFNKGDVIYWNAVEAKYRRVCVVQDVKDIGIRLRTLAATSTDEWSDEEYHILVPGWTHLTNGVPAILELICSK